MSDEPLGKSPSVRRFCGAHLFRATIHVQVHPLIRRRRLRHFKEGVFGCIRSDVSGIQLISIAAQINPRGSESTISLYRDLRGSAKSWQKLPKVGRTED
jgi:hypothetical protein